jgi:hypothetical protein
MQFVKNNNCHCANAPASNRASLLICCTWHSAPCTPPFLPLLLLLPPKHQTLAHLCGLVE